MMIGGVKKSMEIMQKRREEIDIMGEETKMEIIGEEKKEREMIGENKILE